MINRELIRIKTVQLLYSYLLVENPFSLESQPSAPTKEKRFAYSLYLDLLALLLRLAGEVDPRSGHPLADTRFVRNVRNDDRMKVIMARNVRERAPFSGLEKELAAKIKESGIYRRFKASIDEGNPDENVWKEILELIVLPDEAVNREIAGRENYTLKGVDRMRSIMEVTFSNFFASGENVSDALKVLQFSMQKTRELYFRLLALPIAITELRERDIDNARFKLLQTREELNPNTRFVDNEYVAFLRGNEEVQRGIEEFGINWLAENEDLIRALLRLIMQSAVYTDYMQFPATDFKTDCELWRNLYRYIIFSDETLLEALEDSSVFWNDDIDVIGTFILKSIKKIAHAENPEAEAGEFVVPMFKDEEDAAFGAQLFADVVRRKDYYREIIMENVDDSQWDMERLAFMDFVILMTAICEILNFPKIPLTVSFNEYIEVAKYYSTPKSGNFINGLLGRIVGELQQKKILHKTFNQNTK